MQQGKLGFWGQNLLREEEAKDWHARLDSLKKYTEDLSPYNTVGKLKNLRVTQEDIEAQKAAAEALLPTLAKAKNIGSQVGIYNHGGWGGEPENMIAVCEYLKKNGTDNVGIVYNLHHGHSHLDRLPKVLEAMKPWLLCLNLNGMDIAGDTKGRKILPLGVGTQDVTVLRQIRASGYSGPIGILNHTDEDAEGRLLDNLDGLKWLVPQLDDAKPGEKPKYARCSGCTNRK